MSMFQSVLSQDAKQVGADWHAFSHITGSLAAPDACTLHTPAYTVCKVFMLLHYVAPRIAYIVGAVCAFSGRGASQWRGGGNEWSASAAAALLLLLLLLLMHMNTYISASLLKFWLVMSWNCKSTHTHTLLGCNKDLFTNQCWWLWCLWGWGW